MDAGEGVLGHGDEHADGLLDEVGAGLVVHPGQELVQGFLGGGDELAQAAQIALAGVRGREEHVGEQAGEQVMGLVVEVDISPGSGPGGLSARSHRARVAISCSFLREVLIQSVTSKPSGWAGSRTWTVRPRPSRRCPRTSGTISVEGSKQTMGPAQVRAVGITEPVVLNPPDPAKIRQCEPPNAPSKVRSGGVPPLPQVERSRGLNGMACTTSRSTR